MAILFIFRADEKKDELMVFTPEVGLVDAFPVNYVVRIEPRFGFVQLQLRRSASREIVLDSLHSPPQTISV